MVSENVLGYQNSSASSRRTYDHFNKKKSGDIVENE